MGVNTNAGGMNALELSLAFLLESLDIAKNPLKDFLGIQ